MLELTDGMILYHGSYCEVSTPDLKKCAPYKDFGKGFYVTSSYRQAKKFIDTSLKKAKAQKKIDEGQHYGIITKFKYHATDNMHIKIYSSADADWLHCIVAHRKDRSFPAIVDELKQFDVIGGKIADDATNFTINAYIAGTYGDIGNSEADSLCIGRLLPERLNDQYCFRTTKSIKSLEYIGSEIICRS